MGFFKVYRRGHRGTKDSKPGKSRGKKSWKRKVKKPWKGRIMAWEYAQA